MAIISKPVNFVKGTPETVFLDKDALKVHSAISGDAFWSEPDNWRTVAIDYVNSYRQRAILVFDARQSSPSVQCTVADQARDIYAVESVTIFDKAGGSISIFADNLTSEDLDLTFVSTIWDTDNSGYDLESETGLYRNMSHVSVGWDWASFVTASSKSFTGDFMMVYEATSPDDLLTGWFVGVLAGGVSHGLTVDTDGAMKVHQQGSFRTGSLQSNISAGTNTFAIARVGSTLKYYINGTKVYELDFGSTPTMTAAVRLGGRITDAYEDEIPSEGTPIAYNLSSNPGSGFNLESDGGVSGGMNTSSESFVKSSTMGDADDFAYEWDFDWTGLSNVNTLVGITTDSTAGGTWYLGLTCIETAGSSNQARYWFNGTAQSGFALATGPHTLKIERVGNTFTMYLDGVQVYQNVSWSAACYPTVRPYNQQACTASRKIA